MSKGIVMERHRKFTIVMTLDGSFHKVKPVKDTGIGAEVSCEFLVPKKGGLLLFQPKKSNSLPVRYIAIACMVILFVMPIYLLGGQNKTYAYVSLDINPSLEMEIDEELNVVSISALNDDAKKLIQQLPNYGGEKIEQVIEIIMNKSDSLGLTENGKNVLVGVSYVNDHAVSVLDTLDNYFSIHITSWDIATFQVPKEVRERALKDNISMNKVMADTMDDRTSDPERMIIQPRVNDDDKELIHSFYTNSKSNHQNSGEDDMISVDQKDADHSTVEPQPGKKKTEQHPSERKKKNDESRRKNQHNKSDKVEKKEKVDKIKETHKKMHKTGNENPNKNKKEPKLKKDLRNHESHGNSGNNDKNHGNNGIKGSNNQKDK